MEKHMNKTYKTLRILLTIFAVFAFSCGTGSETGNNPDNGQVTDNGGLPPGEGWAPKWQTGDDFTVKTSYRLTAIKSSEIRGELLGEEVDANGIQWTKPVYWHFTVIQTGWTPDEKSSFYTYALNADGSVSTITIMEVTAPKGLNGDIFSDFDPVVYMVIRESDRKVTGFHYNFIGKNGRYHKTFEIPTTRPGELDAAMAVNLFITPTYLPVLPLKKADYSINYGEDLKQSVKWDGNTYNVTFIDSFDRNPVTQVWQKGRPWFVSSVSANRKSELVPAGRVSGLTSENGYRRIRSALASTTKIEEKFRRPVNISKAFTITQTHIDASVAPEYYPWAGYYWAMKGGAGIFGWHHETKSPAGLIRDDADKILKITNKLEEDMHALRKKLHTLQYELKKLSSGSDEYKAKKKEIDDAQKTFSDKKKEYRTKTGELKDLLKKHFTDSETGVVKQIKEGKISLAHDKNFGPLDKYGLYVMLKKRSSDPFGATRWEMNNHYTPYGPGWYGHCNGWSAASIMTNEPREDLDVELPAPDGNGNITLTFTPGDLKALSSMSYFSGPSNFYGHRYEGYPEDDMQDIYPDVFHRLVTYYIVENHFPLVFDLQADDEVWNYPAYAVKFDINEEADYKPEVDINTATQQVLQDKLGLSETVAKAIITYRAEKGDFKDLNSIKDNVSGVYNSNFKKIWNKAYVARGIKKAFLVKCKLMYSTDGVDETHVDGPNGTPEGDYESYDYRLYTDANGLLLRGEWIGDSRIEHPDFAWVPYGNNLHSDWSDSENPDISFKVLKNLISVREMAPPACKSDADCDEGQTCNKHFGECVTAGGCTTNNDCATGYTCENSTCTEQPSGCGNDPYEPDNGPGSAASMDEGSYKDIPICPEGDEDWYGLVLKKGDIVTVSLKFKHSDGDIDMKLQDSGGHGIGSSASSSDNENITKEIKKDGTYYVKVYGYHGAQNTYDMDVKIKHNDPSACTDDEYEGNNTREAAKEVTLTGDGIQAVLCPQDQDWFKFTVNADGRYIMMITGDDDPDFMLYAGDSTDVLYEGSIAGDTETAGMDLLTGTTYYLKVYSNSGAAFDYLADLVKQADQPVEASVLINEVYYDAPGADRAAAFIELWGTPGMSLDGYSLKAINGNGGGTYAEIALNGQTIPESGFFVIGTPESATATHAQLTDRHADLQNGPDSLQLMNGDQVVDAVAYGNFGNSYVFAGEGAAAPDPAGQSITRDSNHGDTNDNAADFHAATPTPGQ